MNNGCIQIHRKIMDSQVWKNPELFKVFCWCILRANYTDRWVTVATGRGETTVHIKRGQFIFGRLKAAEELNMKPSSVRNRMAKLKKMQNVDIQPDTHFSIVTICNYELYQWEPGGTGQADGQAKDNQRTTKGQPKDTDNKVNKDNKVKNTSTPLLTDANKNGDGFDKFWKAWPGKKGKGKAQLLDKWKKDKLEARFDHVMQILEAEKKTEQWTKEGGRFIPLMSTWLNQQRWDCDVNDIATTVAAQPQETAVDRARRRGEIP